MTIKAEVYRSVLEATPHTEGWDLLLDCYHTKQVADVPPSLRTICPTCSRQRTAQIEAEEAAEVRLPLEARQARADLDQPLEVAGTTQDDLDALSDFWWRRGVLAVWDALRMPGDVPEGDPREVVRKVASRIREAVECPPSQRPTLCGSDAADGIVTRLVDDQADRNTAKQAITALRTERIHNGPIPDFLNYEKPYRG